MPALTPIPKPILLAAILIMGFSSRFTRCEASQPKKLPIYFSKTQSPSKLGVSLEPELEIKINRETQQKFAVIRGNFSRPGARLFGKTSQSAPWQLANSQGKFSLEIQLGYRLDVNFTLTALEPNQEERSYEFTLVPKKINSPNETVRLVYMEAISDNRSSFSKSRVRLAPQISFFIIDASDESNGGTGNFVSAINPGIHLEIAPITLNPIPRLSLNLSKVSIPPSGSKPIENNMPWTGQAGVHLTWWLTKRKTWALQGGAVLLRQPFLLAKDISTLYVHLVDILEPEFAFVFRLTKSFPIFAFWEIGGRYALPKKTAALELKQGWEGFTHLQLTRDFLSPSPLGLTQVFATFGYHYRFYKTDLVSQRIQEMTLQVGAGW